MPRANADSGTKKGGKEQRKLAKLEKTNRVPKPKLKRPLDFACGKARARSLKKRELDSIRLALGRAKAFKRNAHKFRSSFCIKQLDNVKGRPETLVHLQKQCERLKAEEVPTINFSTQYFDQNGELLFCYLADRINDQEIVDILPLSEQYTGRTEQDWLDAKGKGVRFFNDGFDEKISDQYQAAVQTLSHFLQPVFKKDRRHPIYDSNPQVMQYTADLRDSENTTGADYYNKHYEWEDEGQSESQDEEQNEWEDEEDTGEDIEMSSDDSLTDPLPQDPKMDCDSPAERCGVAHMVHGWIQQGQESKGLYLSSDFTRSGLSLSAVSAYYQATSLVAKMLAEMFKVLFPSYYELYKDAFDAGVWIQTDPGPWLGRAIVYKLQIMLHVDRHDVGPTASFPTGFWEGGELLVPQLGAKFAYKKGHIALFLAGKLYHQVQPWKPSKVTSELDLTPGRVGSVFFFPSASMEVLRYKKAGWGRNTAYGRMNNLVPQ